MIYNKARKEKQVASQQLIKESNLNLIFNLINKHESISRAELAQITRLSPTTVSSLTEELMQNGMILETGAGTTATSGRKPIMLEVDSNGGFVASVEFIEKSFRCSVYNLKCKFVDGFEKAVIDYSSIAGQIICSIDEILNRKGIDKNKLLGIIIGVPGLIDHTTNRILSSTVITIDPDNDFVEQIKQYYTHIPVLMQNESCLSAYAEKVFGLIGDVRSLIFIDINVGIGAGIILDGQIFTGASGTAGEVGHMSIDMNGPKCKCGNRGCLEVMTSIPAMLQKIVFTVMMGRDTVVKELVNNDYNRINMSVITEALKLDDELVTEVIDETAVRLAFGVNNVINLFNPEVVVIGGELKELGDSFLDKLKFNIQQISLSHNINTLKIKYSNLTNESVTIGGAKYLLDNIFYASKNNGKQRI